MKSRGLILTVAFVCGLASAPRILAAQRDSARSEPFGGRDTVRVELIHDSDGWGVSEWTTILSTVTAILAVIIGPIAGYATAQRQIMATTISTNRQAWINDLRERIAEFISVLVEFGFQFGEKDIQSFRQALSRVVFLRGKILLMLNPNEEDHKLLAEKLNSAFELTVTREFDRLQVEREEILTLSQKILKREWERVKRGR